MEHISDVAKRTLIGIAIKRNISRHYKRLEERLECLNLPIVAWETISREFRFLEKDLLKDCGVENEYNK